MFLAVGSHSPCRPGFLQLHQNVTAAVIVAQLGVHKCSQISDTVDLCLFDLTDLSVSFIWSIGGGGRCAYVLHPTIDIFTGLFVFSFLNTKFFFNPKVLSFGLLHLCK